MHKLLIDKNENALDVVSRVIESPEKEITVVFPRGTAFAGDAENFSVLRREAEAAGKKVTIESVDDDALSFARVSGLTAIHPLLRNTEGRVLSDIIPAVASKKGIRKAARGVMAAKTAKRTSKKSGEQAQGVSLKVPPTDSEFVEDVPEVGGASSTPSFPESRPAETAAQAARTFEVAKISPAEFSYHEEPPKRKFPKKFAIGSAAVFVAALLVAWCVSAFFGKATVVIDFEKTPWEYRGELFVRKSDAAIDVDARVLPGELFTEKRNLTVLFPASGKAEISAKASGKITVYNAYSSAPQPLVVNTRFETPDGKIFRLIKSITVPAATVKDGKIEPASIEVDIVADVPGEAYNVGPIEKLTIPGFKNTVKFDKFYGAITAPLSGGFVGEKAIPTDADIASAKDNIRERLLAVLKSGVLLSNLDEFVFVDGASEISVTKLAVVSSTDKDGKFAVFAEGELRAVAFRIKDANALFAALSEPQSNGMTLKDIFVSYSNPISDFEKGTLTLTAEARGTLTGDFVENELKKELAGKSVNDAKGIVLSLQHLSQGTISIWPFYRTSAPEDIRKIRIEVR